MLVQSGDVDMVVLQWYLCSRYKVYLENEDDAHEDSSTQPLPNNPKVCLQR
jgi:hypothetical protein